MKFSKAFLSISVITALAVSGAAFAVDNGGFELPEGATQGDDPDNWVVSDSAAVGINNLGGLSS